MYADIAATFHALGDTTRIKIMLSLFDQELATSDLSAIISASESLVSQHLRVLRQGRLVKHERRGKRVEDTLDDAHIRTLLTVCLHHLGEDAVQQTAVSLAPNAMVRAKT
jgi:DNA-binding transcriptional ArsR family regulator